MSYEEEWNVLSPLLSVTLTLCESEWNHTVGQKYG